MRSPKPTWSRGAPLPEREKDRGPPGALVVLNDRPPRERHALSARWPAAVQELDDDARAVRVRAGSETVLLDAGTPAARGFVRAVLHVPLGHDDATVYGVFVEVDREGYLALRAAFRTCTPTRVWGKLAVTLPHLGDACGSDVLVYEDGTEHRARVVEARHALLLAGPPIGPRSP